MVGEQNVASLSGVVTFLLGGQCFGLPVEVIREVAPNAWLDRPPQSPSLVHGVLNLGGQAVTVLRLDRLLGLADGRFGLEASILVMRGKASGDAVFGLLVEHVDAVRPGEAFTVMGSGDGGSFNGCLAGQLSLGEQMVHLLAWDNLLLAEERIRLAEFHAVARTRLAELGEKAS